MILIGPNTFSGAEAFTNDMKVFKRATIVGEPSGGGANSAKEWFTIGQFQAYIPEGEAINPRQRKLGEKNWEGVGITPDVSVSAKDALNEAILIFKNSKKIH